ncbi:SRPBCC domain-containing protein [Microbacterium sp. X-17]|uniref:SRPBCC family protein n=1 Tax=Microbacterium sp. X-17 TaxID=3144404 RepID=UPI0031F52D61
MTDLQVRIERVFAIERSLMWELWTTPEHASRWMRPSVTDYAPTTAFVDARVGGGYRFEMHFGEETYATSGRYLVVAPIDRLSFTWKWDEDEVETVVEVEFTDHPGGTQVSIVHSRFETDDQADRHGDGWQGCLRSLAELYEPVPS